METQPQLETERLVLEPLETRHARPHFTSLSEARLFRFIPQDPPVSEVALCEQYTRLQARKSPDRREHWLNWTMCLPGTDAYVGTLQATACLDGTAYVAYMVFTQHQGYGYATEGLHRVLQYLRTVMRVRRFVAHIDTRNIASIAVVERLGFMRAATIHDADFFKGASSDEYRFELIVDSA